MLEVAKPGARREAIERVMCQGKLTAGDLAKDVGGRRVGQPADRVLRRACGVQRIKQPVNADAGAGGRVAEQLGQPIVQDAARAQSASVGGVLGAASAADMVRWAAGAMAADRLFEARVAQQPAGLAARRATGLGGGGVLVAGAADRSFGPVRGDAPAPVAVRAGLRRDRGAGAAEHPAATLAAARAHAAAALAGDGRTRPADRAQGGVLTGRHADDRADASASPACADGVAVALLAARAPIAGAAD